jgi:hypothetical protein
MEATCRCVCAIDVLRHAGLCSAEKFGGKGHQYSLGAYPDAASQWQAGVHLV